MGAWLVFAVAGIAQPFVMAPGPKSPDESLKCIQVRPGFTVELMAADPLVMDPIAFAWGPDGKFWVVEMGDYPLGLDGKNKFGGRIKFLEKTGGEAGRGPYDKATIFLDNLGYPTGVTPWRNGVIVTCAPDIFYAEDTDGDGKADKKELLFTGFREGNQQHRVNGLVWGLDGWLYGANGDSGGVVKSIKTGKEVNISGRDFRLKPDAGEFEAVTGQTQFGRCRDDWGNWFGNNNSNPFFHFVLEDRYLKRNPHVIYPDPRVNVSVKPGASPVYPVSKALPRFNDNARLNHITSACSAIIYRDDLFGPEFYGNSFVSEPVHNLIHREIVKPKGVTFTSKRADDEQTSEFLASSDNWFRPAMIAVGPDGALWVADMYRYVIEHPEWIPKDWQKKLDLRAGHDLGRIYRVYPKNKKPREMPAVFAMDARGLIKALESPGGWTRDMAQQRLMDRGSAVAADLAAVVSDRRKPALARIHALHALQRVNAAGVWGLVPGLLRDDHAEVRRHALAVCDDLFGAGRFSDRAAEPIWDTLPELVKDPSPGVRLQLAYTLGYWPSGGAALGTLFRTNSDDRFIAAAALSSVRERNWPGFFETQFRAPPLADNVVPALFKLANAYGKPLDVGRLMAAQLESPQGRAPAAQMARLASLLDTLDQGRSNLRALIEASGRRELTSAIKEILAAARSVAADPKAPAPDKLLAIRLLGRGLDQLEDDRRLLASLLAPQQPEEIQAAAVQRLGGMRDAGVPEQLLASWKSLSPKLRGHVLDVLQARPEWARLALAALEHKKILPQEIDTIRRQRFLDHPSMVIRSAAARIFAASTDPDRARLVARYASSLSPQPDATRGSKHFEKHCAACHQLGGIGQQVGPDLASVGDKSPEGLLVAILDPNRALEARYVNYLATTRAGLTVSGLLQGETSTTITLVTADGKKHELLRQDLDELTSTGKSAMPEGFEKDLSPADMADLIAFLRGHLAKPKTFAGNRPETVKADKDGVLRLLATSAAIYGKTLVFEDKQQNIGHWFSPDDQAVWTIDVPGAQRYEVWLDFACDPSVAGNILAVQGADSKITHKVGSTASWDLYRRVKIGTLRLPAGRHVVAVRAEGAIRGALIDLRAVELTPAP
jgi:putative membrane-bound dehydrogenase-like protein